MGGPYPELEALDTLEKLEEEVRLNATLEAKKTSRSSGRLQKFFGWGQRKSARP